MNKPAKPAKAIAHKPGEPHKGQKPTTTATATAPDYREQAIALINAGFHLMPLHESLNDPGGQKKNPKLAGWQKPTKHNRITEPGDGKLHAHGDFGWQVDHDHVVVDVDNPDHFPWHLFEGHTARATSSGGSGTHILCTHDGGKKANTKLYARNEFDAEGNPIAIGEVIRNPGQIKVVGGKCNHSTSGDFLRRECEPVPEGLKAYYEKPIQAPQAQAGGQGANGLNRAKSAPTAPAANVVGIHSVKVPAAKVDPYEIPPQPAPSTGNVALTDRAGILINRLPMEKAKAQVRVVGTAWERPSREIEALIRQMDGWESKYKEPLYQNTPWTITDIGDIDFAIKEEWVIDGWLPQNGIGMTYGPSQTFKSFLKLDQMAHIATGTPWMGCEIKKPGPCFYIVAEDYFGTQKRLVRLRERYPGLVGNIKLVDGRGLNAASPEDVKTMVEALQGTGCTFSYGCIDTFSKTSAGINENNASEVAAYYLGVQRVAEQLECFIEVVGHTGKDEDRGARGSNVATANLDCTYKHKRMGDKIHVVNEKQKNAPEDGSFFFEHETAEIAHGGETTTTVDVIYCSDTMTRPGDGIHVTAEGDGRKLSLTLQAAMDAIHEAILIERDNGQLPPPAQSIPGGVAAARKSTIQSVMDSRNLFGEDADGEKIRKQSGTWITRLQERKAVGQYKADLGAQNVWVWVC